MSNDLRIGRAGLRLRPIRPLPRALTREGPNVGASFYLFLFFICKYFWEVLKHFSLQFFLLLKKLKELSNVSDKDKTNLNK